MGDSWEAVQKLQNLLSITRNGIKNYNRVTSEDFAEAYSETDAMIRGVDFGPDARHDFHCFQLHFHET